MCTAEAEREALSSRSTVDRPSGRSPPGQPFTTSGTPDPQFGSDPVSDPDLHQWRFAIEQLSFAHRMLAADVRELEDDALDDLVPGLEYTVWILLHGIVEHGTYHAGQIAILARALEGGQP